MIVFRPADGQSHAIRNDNLKFTVSHKASAAISINRFTIISWHLKNNLYICRPNGRFMNASKEHILKIAFSLFLQKSFKAVTMSEIVKKTGLSKGAFYHYFSSKEELFNEIVQTYYLNLMAVKFEKFEQKAFKDFYRGYIDYIADEFIELKNMINDTNDWNYYSLSFDAVNLFPNFKKKVKEYHALELKAWSEAVERGKLSGELNTTMDNMQVARMFVYSGDGIGLHLMQEGRVKLLENETLKLWDSFYSQIVAK